MPTRLLALMASVCLVSCGFVVSPDADGVAGLPLECPPGMAWVDDPSGPVVLGLNEQKIVGAHGAGLPLTSFQIQHEGGGFCIDSYHVPGEGRAWLNGHSEDFGAGTSRQLTRRLQQALPEVGRRLCTGLEIWYVQGGEDNWRFPYDPWDGLAVDCAYDTRYALDAMGNPTEPDGLIGDYAGCCTSHSDWRVCIQERATWATRPVELLDAMRSSWWADELGTDWVYDESPSALMLNVTLSGEVLENGSVWADYGVGGYHHHPGDSGTDIPGNPGDNEGSRYADDGWVTCVDLEDWSEEGEAVWQGALAAAAEAGTYDALVTHLEDWESLR